MALCDEDRIEAAIMSGPRAWAAAADGPHSGVLAHSSTDDDQRAAAAVVAFDLAYDAANPLNWRAGKKWVVTDVLFATGFNRIMVFARTKETLIAARFLAGFGAPAPSKHSARASLLEQRRRPLRVYLMTPLLGAGVGTRASMKNA
ncbi:caffeine resistance [Cordyceps militaris]|uniref:Caffeine resistance n=1 Tax=Cordyceps militaris TaxID=73501 RepID=A0A2H4SLC6_CORMI|nr:caffeine resistance [Cordyceps militaris]